MVQSVGRFWWAIWEPVLWTKPRWAIPSGRPGGPFWGYPGGPISGGPFGDQPGGPSLGGPFVGTLVGQNLVGHLGTSVVDGDLVGHSVGHFWWAIWRSICGGPSGGPIKGQDQSYIVVLLVEIYLETNTEYIFGPS